MAFSITRQLKSIASFFRSEQKANPVWSGIVGEFPQPHMMPRNYKSFAQEGYRTDPSVYKAISYITRNGAAIPPKLYTDKAMEEEIESHPLLDRLDTPNNEQSGMAYREAVLGFLLLAGNSYQYAIRQSKNGPPLELWPLRPDYVQVISAKKRGITGYKYQPEHTAQGPDAYDPADVGHIKYWCPDDDAYGLSPLEVAALNVDQQTAARKWNLALLQNMARPPGAWTTPAALGYNERQRLENSLKEKLQGWRNAGKPPVLDAGLKWESMGLPPAQMDWLEGMGYNANQIASIYGLAPVIVGDTSAMTYDNMMQAEAFSYTEGIFPDLDKLYALWNMWLLPMYPDLVRRKAYLYYDKTTVEAIAYLLRQQKESAAKRANEGFLASVWTLNDARKEQDLPEIEGGDRIKLGNSLIPIELLKQPIIINVTPSIGFSEQRELGIPPALTPEPTPALPPGKEPLQLPAPSPKPQANQQPNEQQTQKAREAKKLAEWQVEQRQAITNQLNDYAARGVTHLQWRVNGDPCEVCQENDGETVEAGEPFPNGVVLPPVHPNCMCEIDEVSPLMLETAKNPIHLETKRKPRRGDEYRQFMEAMV